MKTSPCPAPCQAGPHCHHTASFRAVLFTGLYQPPIATIDGCASHLTDIVETLTTLAHRRFPKTRTKVTVWAIDPTAPTAEILAALAFTLLLGQPPSTSGDDQAGQPGKDEPAQAAARGDAGQFAGCVRRLAS